MFCVHCGVELVPDGKFCQGCGNAVRTNAMQEVQPEESRSHSPTGLSRPSFKGLRRANWAIVILMTVGFGSMLIRASSDVALVWIGLLGAVFMLFPLTSAISLGSDDLYLLGIYVRISEGRRHWLRRVALVLNWIIFGFGVVGMVACIATGQIAPAAGMLLYVIVPGLNIKALRELNKFERKGLGYEPTGTGHAEA